MSSPATTAPVRWRVACPGDLRGRSWDGVSVVHHVPSGDTQLLNALAAATLQRIAAGAIGVEALVEAACKDQPAQPRADIDRQVRTLLAELADVGIIEPDA